MAVPRIVFFHDSYYPQLKPFYEAAIQQGAVAFAGSLAIEDGRFVCRDEKGEPQQVLACDYVAAGAQNRYLSYKKPLNACGVPDERIIDGCTFAVPGINLPQFFADGSICGRLVSGPRISYHTVVILPAAYRLTSDSLSLQLGRLSYIGSCVLEERGSVTVGDFSGIAWNQTFELGLNGGHHAERVSCYDWRDNAEWTEFHVQKEPLPIGRINIGSDVWIGRGCHLKSTSANHPLSIGDGAIIASDSNVVKDVPPYAIVGGNPAKFIRWRFPEHIREGLQKIRWWDWPLEKIHAARLDMKDPAAFVEKYLPKAE